MKVGVKVQGAKQLKKNLRKIADLPYDKVEDVVKDACKPIVQDAKANLAASGVGRTGELENSLGTVTRIYARNHTVAGVSGPMSGHATINPDGSPHDPKNIGHLIEFGHGGPHPAPAYPFLRPAHDGNARKVLKDIKKGIGKLIKKQTRKYSE